ncbi:polyprenyl synthetase family protein [Oceanobacillus bengalensis]|uniref:Polyprenyl synthetase family protein n=1 Tax=Oceanobacillus bengalensis TaxID=1435466 RepID=A0A494YZL5_9BACI|nr:polyprenyl synthetase family protein [Oceanobacillus bengalensis]RKQ15602.1 polyprenyl synthetase family protein [Oceanobacillus bengalensis]
MKEALTIQADKSYHEAEQKATAYFTTLTEGLEKQAFIKSLTKDIQTWKQSHIQPPSIFSRFTRKRVKADTRNYQPYLQWLDVTGKLDNYLDRSISYIFMRDLGKALDEKETQSRIEHNVTRLKKYLLKDGDQTFSMAKLYRMAEKEGVESTLIWMFEKLKNVSSNIPQGMDADEAQRKLIKIIAGVVMQVIEEMAGKGSPEERKRKLEEAIRLGYAYGLTYPFIDDLLDSNVLSREEQKRYSDLIRTTLLTGTVPELGDWGGKNGALMKYIHSELRDAFEYMKAHQLESTWRSFLEQSYVFFKSQEVDRLKDLSDGSYTNERLYIPVIVKAASSRLIVRSIIRAAEDEGIDKRTFYYGIYNQLADDFADMFEDLEEGRVTPYTYYLKYHAERQDLINPFELYWAVIGYLIHEVYHSDEKTREVILDRAINGLKRYEVRMGTDTYDKVMGVFATFHPEFNRLIEQMAEKADDVDFFDKLLRDHILSMLKDERKEQEDFMDSVKTIRKEINSELSISIAEKDDLINEQIIDAANYSLKSDGKRLRPIITWFMGVRAYGLEKDAIMPLLKSLEYMHTASLIFDDLPSQDNAPVRRGRQTVHETYNVAVAELTGLFLTQKAVEEQSSLHTFDSGTVLQLVNYSARIIADMCRGQAMDLDSKGKNLTLEQLNVMCFYKTGMGFEASLVMPAILRGVGEAEKKALRTFAYHAGIAFQIKDDLLDVEGNENTLGKPTSKDAENSRSTFVSILGQEGARKEMWEHYCSAMDALEQVPQGSAFLKHLLNYIINRDY